jgi:hypothetical protein
MRRIGVNTVTPRRDMDISAQAGFMPRLNPTVVLDCANVVVCVVARPLKLIHALDGPRRQLVPHPAWPGREGEHVHQRV